MTVKLIGITKPSGIEGIDDAEKLITYIARVSNPSNQSNTQTSNKLLKYLMDNKHWSPFEMVNIIMEINTTRDIGRQILRHRSFVFQEFSQRYSDPTKNLGFIIREARLQDTKNRQNSFETDDETLKQMWHEKQQNIINQCQENYKWAVENGIAKEQSRVVLPEGLTLSRMYMSGSLRSWIHYCQLRMGNGTQKEHREIAEECWKIILNNFPSLKN